MSRPSRHPVPARTTRVETRAGNSRFIATIARTDTMDAARAFVQSIREEMPDATHHVYAIKVGFGASVTEGVSDDGEPGGTSGPPVLAVLRGADLGDATIVVTRYFGGTKLGTGGLVSAYGDAARAVIDAVPTELKVHRIAVRFTVDYAHQETARRLIESADGLLDNEEYGAGVTVTASIPDEELDGFQAALRDATAGRSCAEPLD